MSKSSNKKDMSKIYENNNQPINIGIITQQSDIISIDDLFNSYFDITKPNIIKNEKNNYEFSLDEINDRSFHFSLITEKNMSRINDIYNFFDFFLIFIDIQSTTSLKVLEIYIDQLIDCSQENTKKCYIFGMYKDSNKIINKDEQINNLLNLKGIDYEYSEINININEGFHKGIQFIIQDSKEIMEEIEFQDIHLKYNRDKGKSCLVM